MTQILNRQKRVTFL